MTAGKLPDDVVRLVIAAREYFYPSDHVGIDADIVHELDKALEAFSSLVPWDDEPDDKGELIEVLRDTAEWMRNLPIPTDGCTRQLLLIKEVLSKHEADHGRPSQCP